MTTNNLNLDSSVNGIKNSIKQHLHYTLGAEFDTATKEEWLNATCLAVRDRMLDRSTLTREHHRKKGARRVHYLSLEYLMGRLLENNLRNADLYETTESALKELGQDIENIINIEHDMGLGNGGLGRLAACFMDSLSTLSLPAVGYGIHYEFGLFRQEITPEGRQQEQPDAWARDGNPWKTPRPAYKQIVNLYGKVVQKFDERGHPHFEWVDTKPIIGLPWDIPIVGYDSSTVNVLRLWQAQATDEFNLKIFNEGSYVEALREKATAETISKILYPNDSTESGKELRLVQQYFFVACSLADIMKRFKRDYQLKWDQFAEKVAIQLNDTHPAVAVPELMRILLDVEHLTWDQAWEITQQTFAYTNHTLLPEALETWSVHLFERVLPRHLQIIYEINQKFLDNVVEKKWPGDIQKREVLSLIDGAHGSKKVRMAHLSVLGSHATNGVAALHTRLLCEILFPEFNELFPKRFLNMTNGVTFRRWLDVCNPRLSKLIKSKIGTGWLKDGYALKGLEKYAEDTAFQTEFKDIKREHKVVLAKLIKERCQITISPDALFDVQIKRLHEYKRQQLNLLNILTLYRRILDNPNGDFVPRVFIFGAKAAPGYYLAKNIIHAINAVAQKINNDPRVGDKLKVVFIPNYGVSIAERIIPAADLSEQISTAGKEASGTGNMKLALNGALTIGTLDGANVEILEEVGEDNIFIFGLTVEQVTELTHKGYHSWDYYWSNPILRDVIDWLSSDYFTGHANDFMPIRHSLLEHNDEYLTLVDYQSYVDTQCKVDEVYKNQKLWVKKAILNTARVGKFSSDRTISEYAKQIWNLQPLNIN
jgi:starch phosphorylase